MLANQRPDQGRQAAAEQIGRLDITDLLRARALIHIPLF
jgi:hypothetical protein